MQISITDDVIEVSIRGNLDFNTAQELLLRCKAHSTIHPTASAQINIENVVNIRNCGISAILLIAEWMPGGLQIILSQCSSRVHQCFDLGIGNQYLSTGRTLPCSFICNRCFDNNDYPLFVLDSSNSSVHSVSRAKC